jgi:hypothetical protein
MSVNTTAKVVARESRQADVVVHLLRVFRAARVLRAGASRVGQRIYQQEPADTLCLDAALDKAAAILKKEGLL